MRKSTTKRLVKEAEKLLKVIERIFEILKRSKGRGKGSWERHDTELKASKWLEEGTAQKRKNDKFKTVFNERETFLKAYFRRAFHA